MDGVDPALTDQLTALLGKLAPAGTSARLRWSGHRLHAEVTVPVSQGMRLDDLAALAGRIRHGVGSTLPDIGSVAVVPRFAPDA